VSLELPGYWRAPKDKIGIVKLFLNTDEMTNVATKFEQTIGVSSSVVSILEVYSSYSTSKHRLSSN